MANLAIIPARGGSKRIPRKNIKLFLGKPIIAYPIEAALKSNLFDEVVVSTDDVEIAEIAQKYGAKALLRSKENSDDFATLFHVVQEVLGTFKNFNAVSCILATSVFVTPKLLNQAYTILKTDKTDSVLPVVPFSYPIQRALKKNSNGDLTFFYPENFSKRTQDLEIGYHDAGMFYFTKTESFLKPENNKLSCGTIKPLILSELETQDIDTVEDWNLAEFKFKHNNK
ncbi:pseudaminic acid cytidylyltransferase [Algibacter sp. AS12]|uniref:pseudaminic acid cytidylyltransferase n=1 Tax=Algibacter sp. AS12 TaxID=3135773 RepID=UPI00398B1220